jgi:glycine/D-amino acid oxidase-like deaminating enzyme
MTDDPRSHGLWALSAAPAPETAPLDGAARADVAVIGAGYTGLSAALHLAQGGAKVTVLEAREIGHGGSGRNVGLVNAGLWVMPDDIEATLGPSLRATADRGAWRRPALVWELAQRHQMQCEATHKGTLHCAVGEDGLAALRERETQWRKRGAPVRVLDAREAQARTGTQAYAGALLDDRAGTIQPLGYARGLAHAAQAQGAVIHTQSPVTAARRDGDLWRLDTPGGTLEAPQVILATNAYTETLWPELRHEIVHLPFFSFSTAPLSAEQRARILPGGEGCWDTRKVLTAFRLDAAGRLMLGSVGRLRGVQRACHHGWARRMLRRLYPELGDRALSRPNGTG